MNDFNEQTLPLQNVVFNIALSPDFTEDGVCFAASTSGLLLSHDGGQTWGQYHQLLTDQVITAIALSPSYRQDKRLFVGLPGGILVSNVDGDEWRTAVLPREAPQVSVVICSPDFASDGIVFAATDGDGVFRSTSRGTAWDAWNFGLLDLSVISLAVSPAFADDEALFAGTATGLFRSKNGGRAWREVDLGREVTVLSVAFSPNVATDGSLYAGTEEGLVFHSADRGNTWQMLEEMPGNWPVNALAVTTDQDGIPSPICAIGEGLWVWQAAEQRWRSAVNIKDPLCLTLLPAVPGDEVAALVGTAQGTIERCVWRV